MSPLFIVPFYPKNTSQLERYAKIHKTISIPYVQHQMSFSTPRISSNNLPWYQFLSHNMKASHGASSLPQSPHQGKTWENDRKPTNGWSSVCENLSTSTLTIRHLQARPDSAKMAAINQKIRQEFHIIIFTFACWSFVILGNWGGGELLRLA